MNCEAAPPRVIIILSITVGVAAVAANITWRNLRDAPVGYEDETGFHAIRCRGCSNLKEDGRGHQCGLGYPIRSGFFTGVKPVDICQARMASEVAMPEPQKPAGKTRRGPLDEDVRGRAGV